MDPVNVLAKAVALPVPETIGGILRNFGQSLPLECGHAHAPFSLKTLMSFCSDGPCECTGEI